MRYPAEPRQLAPRPDRPPAHTRLPFPPESRSFQLGRQGIVWMHLDREPVSGIEQLDQQREDRALAVENRLSENLGWRGGDCFREPLPEKWATADRALIT